MPLIPGATAITYELQPEDVGFNIFCRVRGTNAAGFDIGQSNTVGPVASSATLPSITTAPVVTVAVDGASVTTTDGTWTGTEPITYEYQWFSDEEPDVAIPGATSATYVIDGGVIEEGPSFSAWNPADMFDDATGTIDFSNGNRTATGRFISGYSSCSVRGTGSQSTGKKYFEMTIDALPSNAWVLGLSDIATALTEAGVPGGNDAHGISLHSSAPNLLTSDTGAGFWTFTTIVAAVADVMGWAVDFSLAGGTVWLRHNGTWVRGDPVAGTDGFAWGVPTGVGLVPYLKLLSTTDPDGVVTLNMGDSAFAHTIPSGYSAWG